MTSVGASKNRSLKSARSTKNDEFYTQWADIEREMNAYLDYDRDVFKDKTILLPCDDPEWSNFAKFFALHFHDYGLKKLIATSYAPDSNHALPSYQPTLFETQDPKFDKVKTRERGKLFVLDRDVNGDGIINIEDLQWDYLEGDGDFRSEEVTALRDQADIIVTNPPFSQFREFIAWILAGEKKFSVIGSKNAITYKEIFPLVKGNQLWLGNGFANGNAYFRIPEGAQSDYASGVYDEATGLVKFRNVDWFTNIDHGRRHAPLDLMSTADNIKFSKHKEVRGTGYRPYDNYRDAIDIPYTDAIPSDHHGVMGVPISFLNRYNPDQFEIIGITDRDNPHGLKTREYTAADAKNHSDLNRRGALREPDGTLKSTYARILIRRKVGAA